MTLDRAVHAPETAAGAVAALAAVPCQGRVVITPGALCAALAVLPHQWRVT